MKKTIGQLKHERPRNRFARWSAWTMLGLVIASWSSDAFSFRDLGSERALRNLDRFLTELRPHPLQNRDWDWGIAAEWFSEKTGGIAGEAMLVTLSLSIAAIVLAALMAFALGLFAARNLANPEPFLPRTSPPSNVARGAWAGVVWLTRSFMILVRAVPEYLWAFILLTLFGPGAFPAIFALALHNAGILGKLFAEVVENRDPRTPRALRGLGASRSQIVAMSVWPAALNRFLLFFFYRWETCVREATILGLLGLGGLGAHILQAKAAIFWDELLLWTLLGSVLILAGDLVSAYARRVIRNAR